MSNLNKTTSKKARLKKSPLAPDSFPELPVINGLKLGAIASGETYQDRDDLMLATFEKPATVAAVVTTSTTCSAAVDWCKLLRDAAISARALVVNAGNANVFTGKQGAADVSIITEKTATVVGCDVNQVWHSSTGVIGQKLKVDRITTALPTLHKNTSDAPSQWMKAAQAIATTDTFLKGATVTLENGVIINGIAKGSGMIMPNMATMLCYVFTDANIGRTLLQTLLQEVIDETFNCITVDSDTSTSDTTLLFSTGEKDIEIDAFKKGLQTVLKNLALQVVRDGEGAQKLIEIQVTGAVSRREAKKVGFTVANSPLVKTAIAGEDANWGRVVMAVGKSGVPIRRRNLSVGFGDNWIAREGEIVAGYDEAPIAAHLKTQNITINIDLGLGKSEATVWTCDLTKGYIEINADYRS